MTVIPVCSNVACKLFVVIWLFACFILQQICRQQFLLC